jgi:hypothetical protein
VKFGRITRPSSPSSHTVAMAAVGSIVSTSPGSSVLIVAPRMLPES